MIEHKVIIDFCPKLAFEYLDLPGKYHCRHDKEFGGTDGSKYQLDSLFQAKLENESSSEDLIINVEHQSSRVSLDKMRIINMYAVHASYFLACPVVSIVLTDVDSYNKSIKEYEIEGDVIHKPRYVYFTNEEINEKMNNLRKKHDLNETLSDMEAMDLAFLPIMVPKYMRKKITSKLVNLFKNLKIRNETIIALISHVLNLMLSYFFKGDELIELKGMMKMGFEESRDKLMDARINEMAYLKEKIRQEEEKTKKANKERDEALSKNNYFIEAFNNLKKQGKLSEKDLISVGIIL